MKLVNAKLVNANANPLRRSSNKVSNNNHYDVFLTAFFFPDALEEEAAEYRKREAARKADRAQRNAPDTEDEADESDKS